jgi:hypothetical protein
MSLHGASSGQAAFSAKPRDERIDLARGLTMLIIFVAHVPANSWAEFVPARFGFSSGAEAFVLCSGLASGIAFGGTFRRDGWTAGSRRIGRRVLQLWFVQLAAFAAFALLLSWMDALLGGQLYRDRYALTFVQQAPVDAGLALATLRYVPVYFDILPLYIVVLAAVPAMMALAALSPRLALGASGLLWLAGQIWPLNLPAHPLEDRLWYFDPLAWQFLFFVGFGVTAKWFTPPAPTRLRIVAAGLFITACIPLTFWGAHQVWPTLEIVYRLIYPAEAITTLHPLRLIHVLALGWLFAALLFPVRHALAQGGLKPVFVVGQQSLITFVTGIFLSALAGVALDLAGRGFLATAIANLLGMALLIATAHAARAFKARAKTTSTRMRMAT